MDTCFQHFGGNQTLPASSQKLQSLRKQFRSLRQPEYRLPLYSSSLGHPDLVSMDALNFLTVVAACILVAPNFLTAEASCIEGICGIACHLWSLVYMFCSFCASHTGQVQSTLYKIAAAHAPHRCMVLPKFHSVKHCVLHASCFKCIHNGMYQVQDLAHAHSHQVCTRTPRSSYTRDSGTEKPCSAWCRAELCCILKCMALWSRA